MKTSPADTPLSPVFADPARRLPRVGRREPAWRFLLSCAGVGCFGAMVFMSLSHGRLHPARAEAQAPPASAPPGTVPPPAPAAAYLPQPAPPPRPAAVPAQPDTGPDETARLRAPALVFDAGEPPQAGQAADAQTLQLAQAAARAGAAGAPVSALDSKATAEELFSSRLNGSSVETAHATRLRDTALITPQGTVIPAVLETAMNSDLPGFVSAVVSRDVRGYDNTTVLIPKGSKLVGQYRNGVSAGQSRIFVVWTRLLTPAGVSIDLDSPSADDLGRGGVAGETNTHFLRRFGSSILLTVMSAGLAAATNTGNNSSTAIVIGAPALATNNPAAIALGRDIDIPDTIDVKPGAAIRVLVAKDLDFSDVVARPGQ